MRKKRYLIRYVRLVFSIGKIGSVFAFGGLLVCACINMIFPYLISNIVDLGIEGKNLPILINLSGIYFILVIIVNGINLKLDYYFQKLKLKISTKLKTQIIEDLTMAKGEYLAKKETGNLLKILNDDLINIEEFGIDTIYEFVINIFTLCAVIIILLQFDVRLVLVVLIIQVFVLGINLFMTGKINKSIKRVRNIIGKQANNEEQFVSNLKNAILSNTTKYFIKRISISQDDYVAQAQKTSLLIGIQKGAVIVLGEFSTIFTYFIGGILIINISMSMGELLAFMKYISLLIAPSTFLVNFNVKLHQTQVSLEKIYGEIEQLELDAKIRCGNKTVNQIEKIQLENLCFAYNNSFVLNHLNICMEKGKIYGIVGMSGCGKSTIINLLYRLWDSQSGKILINNEDIRLFNLESIRNRICIVSQDIFLFDGDIYENLLLDEKVEIKDVEKMCIKMKLTDLIDEEVNNIGERGDNISGGQRQRIAIGRALLKNCDVYVFDEATSALDNTTQKIVFEIIHEVLKHKIVIMIAHRTEIIKEIEHIFVMDKGCIIENGNHQELMKNKGEYYKIMLGKKEE